MRRYFNVFLIIIAILIIIVGAIFFYVISNLNKVSYKDISKNNIIKNEGTEDIFNEYRNIVILGVDSNQNDYEGTRRSDCIIIVSINNNTKQIKLVSVYRDTYLDISNYGLDKVNHAYAYGGEEQSINTLNENLDLNIDEFITINFEAVKKAIDSIDGIEITVTDKEATQISGISSAGTYNLTGEQALQYGRIRYIDNDYVRTERMRTILSTTFEKAKTLNKIKLLELINNLLSEVQTNISKTEILKLSTTISRYNITNSIGWPYEVRGITLNAWYAVPVTLEENVSRLHEELFGKINYEVSEKVKNKSQKIIDKTGYR